MTGARVLVVDDNALNVELATFLLEAAGFVVASVTSAAEVAGSVAGFRPDLVLMDLQLPQTDGLTLMRRLKSDPATRQIPVVAFTAYAMKGAEDRMRRAGFDGYLSKPIDGRRFADQVRGFLGAAAG